MCRLILATGRFDARDILDAAVDMSCGRTADHDGPTDVHPNGWGAVWRRQDAPHGLAVHRDVRPLGESFHDSPLRDLDTEFLAIHARHATLAKNQGLKCTHPLERDGEYPWYFMHNGFLPTVYQLLGLPESEFDSREYFDYIVPRGARRLDEASTLKRLGAIPAGGSSGNAIVVNPENAYVIHWTTPGNPAPRYFGMYTLRTPRFRVIASEVVPALAPPEQWEPLKPDHVVEIPLTPVPSPVLS
jgi:predicted glutamine amidotransferase